MRLVAAHPVGLHLPLWRREEGHKVRAPGVALADCVCMQAALSRIRKGRHEATKNEVGRGSSLVHGEGPDVDVVCALHPRDGCEVLLQLHVVYVLGSACSTK